MNDGLADLQRQISFLDLARELGFDWEQGRAYDCPTGHSSSSSACCRVYRTGAYCFSCRRSFHHIGLIRATQACTDQEAIAKLAEIVGVPASGLIDAEAVRAAEEQADVIWARTAYTERASRALDSEHREYLQSRGLDDGTIERFQIGFARAEIIDEMNQDRWTTSILRKAGLVVLTEDSFRPVLIDRIVLPVLLPDGRVVDIVARALPDQKDTPKYLRLPSNSESHPFVSEHAPSGVPYGANTLAESAEQVAIVEGPFDAMALAQHGVAAIALLGSKLAPDEAEWLVRHVGPTGSYVLVLDRDAAGEQAVVQVGLELLKNKVEPSVARIPSGIGDEDQKFDPAEYVRDLDSAAVLNFLGSAPSFLKSYVSRFGSAELSAFQAMQAVKRVVSDLIQHLDYDSIMLVVDSSVWAHFDNLTRTTHRKQIEKFVKDLMARRAAQKVEHPKLLPEEREAGLALLRDPDLLEHVESDLETLGYVGEVENKVLLYLGFTSRKMEKPLSVNLLSPSASGKSSLIDAVAGCMPKEDVIRVTRATPAALYHMEPDALKHKVLIVEERDGMEAANYSIRVLQSENVLKLLIPIKDPETGQIMSQEKEVEGPIAYCDSTTEAEIDEQNATRGFALYVDITTEQTRRIHDAQAFSVTIEGRRQAAKARRIRKVHQDAQRMLRNDLEVVVPFSRLIKFPADLPRTRRDYLRFLGLIQTVAFLYQYQRDVKTDDRGDKQVEYIEATIEDYAVAYHLAARTILSASDDLHAHARQILERTVKWLVERAQQDDEKPENIRFTRRDIAEHTDMGKGIVDKYVPQLQHSAFKVVGGGGQGSTYEYQLASENVAKHCTPELGITTPHELALALAERETAEQSPPSPDFPEAVENA